MGVATTPVLQLISSHKPAAAAVLKSIVISGTNSSSNSMSQGFHQSIFSFSDGFDRPTSTSRQEEQHHHIAQQSRRDKLRVQGGFDPSGHPPLVPIEGEEDEPGGIYGAATGAGNMLSEMFNFPTTPGPSASDLLTTHQMQQSGYRLPSRSAVGPIVEFGTGDWYNSNRHGMVLGGSSSTNLGSIGDAKGLNAESAAAMQLFLMNPPQQPHPRSPSPPPRPPPPQGLHHQAFHQTAAAAGPFGTTHDHAAAASFSSTGGEQGQGLSLSLSSSLQQFEMAKAADQELRVRDGVLYFNTISSSNNNNNLQMNPSLQLQGGQHVHMGQYGPAAATVGVVSSVLRNSKYARAAQELLEEFCSVGRGQLFKAGNRSIGRHHAPSSSNPNPNPATTAAGPAPSVAGSSSSSKDVPAALSPADRFEHQRKKSKLLSMLDEVDRRYNHYCDQMQMVVNSFDSVMGFGAATPYTALAQKAMSRHFRCLKDAIATQLKRTCEVLGEKEAAGSSSGITKGETPRLRLLDQSLRQQRAFHQMGTMEQEAWRPQRGLPERSVSILRAWLFEHFLHPYPSDADKHLLARQTGLSRNQVSNWFINARVRLWKPMVEEMYQQEAKDQETAAQGSQSTQRDDGSAGINQKSQSPSYHHQNQQQQQHNPQGRRRAPENDAPDSTQQSGPTTTNGGGDEPSNSSTIVPPIMDAPNLYHEYGGLGPAARMRLGTAGDVSLTLGLRQHTGNAPEKNRQFTIRDFGGC